MLRIFSLSILTIFCLYASARQRVILITIDGLRNDILTNASQPAPFLHEMMRKSIYVANVIGVNPTMTYPSHTTLVTGSTPLEHGIHCNRQFQYNRAEPARRLLFSGQLPQEVNGLTSTCQNTSLPSRST